MLSDKLYLRLLGLFAAVIALAQLGLCAYWLSPRQAQPKRSSPTFKFHHISSPVFKYSYRVADGDEGKWREIEIPEKTGRKILELLRGSRNWSTESEAYYRQHPEAKRPWGWHFYPEISGRLEVSEAGSEMPAVCITFLQSPIFDASLQPGRPETFVVLSQNQAELGTALAEAITGPNVLGD